MLKKRSRHDLCTKPMNPQGEKLGTCGLEGIKGSPAEPPEVNLEFNTWVWGVESHFLRDQILVCSIRIHS